MDNYWAARVTQASQQAAEAPSRQLREVYLNLTEHYRSMLKLTTLRRDSVVVDLPQYNRDISTSVIYRQN